MNFLPMAAQAAQTAAARSGATNVPIIGIARWTTGAHEKDENGKLSLAILLPPEFNLAPLEAAIDAAVSKTFGADPRKHSGLRLPIALATDKGTFAGYEPGWHLVRASTKRAVNFVDATGKTVSPDVAAMELYDGRWVEVHVGPYGYNMNGNKGVALGLNGVQLLDAGTQIGRGASTFGAYAAPMETPTTTARPSSQSAWG